MATAAPSPLASSVEKTNGAKLSRLLIDGGTTVLRKVFDRFHPPAELASHLNTNYSILDNLYYERILNGHQWDKLFPPGGATPNSNSFDITLLFCLLANICGLTPPRFGWENKPHAKDKTLPANLARVKFYRNRLAHVTTTAVDTQTFSTLWKEISAPLLALGLDKEAIDRLKEEKSGEEDYLKALLDWVESDEKIKSQLKNIQQSLTKNQQAVEQVCQSLTETNQAVEELRQNQTKIQQTVEQVHQTMEEVGQTQTKTHLTVEEVRQIQTKTKQAVEEVHQTQTKTQLTVEEVRQTQTEIKQTVEEVHHTQTKTQLTVEEVRQTQTEMKQAVEEVHHTQTKTQLTVEEVRQTQTGTKRTVEEVHQTQTKIQQTVEQVHQTIEEVRQTQTKTEQTVEDVATGLQEVKEAVDSLKEAREKDRADEVFQNLVKSEFRGDIEYYAERFQAGTREWVFDRVQNWLNDRSSQNRVMVISGNAGMGKSIIAAVICKIMQEAGRLSGSHFCQHNNVRYRKPQLMLQSLACHLSHALPEYKQALVEQLLRNLGEELKNMNVEELFALLFKEPLSAVGDPGRNMLVVIDGLDESEYQGRNELLGVIANQFCKLPTWVRFVITTRPATNIADKLTHLNPIELQSNDEKNLEDVRTFFEKKLQHHFIRKENVDALVEKLVLKSEGLMLYAHFLILFINENPSVLNQADLDGSLPLKISSVYRSYFKRLEMELMKELDIKEKEFLNLLCAITASREPLPVGFVSKVLVPSTNSPLARRKVLKALGSVSALLPIRDGCLHVIHKSVKDWLTDASCYEEHEFSIVENEGHRILASLCTYELCDLKRRGVYNDQFSATEKYALFNGARHMLHSDLEREPHKPEELTKEYVIDLEIVYAKTCVNSTRAAEDLVWIQKQGICTVLSENSQIILKTLLFLLRKHLFRFSKYPHLVLPAMLNEGGTVLSSEASHLLQNKYPKIPYMEYVRKETQQRGVVARFKCLSRVACLDVSPNLDYMVCECDDGMLQLWSLHTGRLVWTRPVKVTKNYSFLYHTLPRRKLPSSSVFSFYRSVAFHPTEQVVLPGILSNVYTIDGDLKPLFPESNCSFSVCSISGDKTKILTNCPNNAKCLVMWSLENGSEIARITRNEDVLSFALSRDGRLLAVSHSNGSICLLDVMDGFRTLAETATPRVCGMLKFSPDYRYLFCLHQSDLLFQEFCMDVNMRNHQTFSLGVCSDKVSYHHKEFECFNDCGFLLGDLIPSVGLIFSFSFSFVLNEQSLLSCKFKEIVMMNTNEVTNSSQGTAEKVALSLDGQTVYVVSCASVTAWNVSSEADMYTSFTAWNVSSGKRIAEKQFKPAFSLVSTVRVCPVGRGILISIRCFSSTLLALWKFDLSECVQRWDDFRGIIEMIFLSEERVACVQGENVTVLDTTSGEIVSTIPVLLGRIITCNSKCQLLTVDPPSLLLSDDTTVLWKNDSLQILDIVGALQSVLHVMNAMFSPVEQFLVITDSLNAYVLDAISGCTLRTLHAAVGAGQRYCTFVGDEECVVGCKDHSVKLFNVKSGDLLSVIDNERIVTCLAACPRKRLLAIGLRKSTSNFKVLQVCLPQDKDSRKIKRMNNAVEIEEQSRTTIK